MSSSKQIFGINWSYRENPFIIKLSILFIFYSKEISELNKIKDLMNSFLFSLLYFLNAYSIASNILCKGENITWGNNVSLRF